MKYCQQMSQVYHLDYDHWSERNLDNVSIPNGMTAIGQEEFADDYSMTNIEFPKNCGMIGSYAFAHCSNLREIAIPDTVSIFLGAAFYRCSKVRTVTLPKGLEFLPYPQPSKVELVAYYKKYWRMREWRDVEREGAFEACTGLESIILPDALKEIGLRTFKDCKNLQWIKLNDSLEVIGDKTFEGCESITEITHPNTVTKIGEDAFHDCKNLERVKLSDSLVSIGARAFMNCQRITEITIPNTVTRIGEDAFRYCKNLEVVKILNPKTEVGIGAFTGCKNLKRVEISEPPVNMTLECFDEVFYLDRDFINSHFEMVERLFTRTPGSKMKIFMDFLPYIERDDTNSFTKYMRNNRHELFRKFRNDRAHHKYIIKFFRFLVLYKDVDGLISQFNQEKNFEMVAFLLEYSQRYHKKTKSSARLSL